MIKTEKQNNASVVDVARRQRHLYLLRKVKESKTLKLAELKELEDLELLLKREKKKTLTKVVSKKAVKKKTARKKTGKKKTTRKKQAKRKTDRRKSAPISRAAVKLLALECETFAEADSKTGTKIPLAKVIHDHAKLYDAWERGRLLRSIRDLAGSAATVSECEEALGLEAGKLKSMLDTDAEVADIWNDERLGVIIEIKTALVDEAKKGKPAAAKQVESIIRKEIARPHIDFKRLTIQQIVEITGKTRQTIRDWTTKHGLVRNSDKTYNLAELFAWFEGFTVRKLSRVPEKFSEADPLKAAKAEKLEVDLAEKRGRLLDRQQIIAGLVGRHQNMVTSLNRGAEDLASLCQGKPSRKIAEILRAFFDDIRRSMCKVPEQLRLQPAAEKKLEQLLSELDPEGP